MRKLCYEINPVRMDSILEYKNLSLMEKAVYKELLDLVWKSESQYKIALDSSVISSEIGCEIDLIDLVIEKLSVGKKPLIIEELCLESGNFLLHISELETQIKTFKKQIEIDQQLVDAPRNNQNKAKKTLVSKIRQKENSRPNTKYLSIEDRDLVQYKGWMPTNRFKSSGQVYVVSQDIIDELISKYPDKNLDAEFVRIFEWLVKNEEKRKSLAEMNGFITGWVDRSDNKGSINESSLDDLEDELDRLLNEQLGL